MLNSLGKSKTIKSINVIEKIQLGGVTQWISIRGRDISKPIMLFLHGGPGASRRYYNYQLEKIFIIVNWDQRGSGSSFSEEVSKELINVEQLISDTNELVEFLKKKFNRGKIFLVGHSWGSFLGICAAYRYPNNFYAYVGIGQVVNGKMNEQISYNYTLDMARKYNNSKAIEELTTISRIEDGLYCNGRTGIHKERQWLYELGESKSKKVSFFRWLNSIIAKRIFSLDKVQYKKGLNFTAENLWGWSDNVDLFTQIPQINVPTFILTGRYDYISTFELASKYYNQLEAPIKELIWFEWSSHAPHIEEPVKFYKIMNRVLNVCFNKSI
jgi:pimeloyl-ACP methyl ester carboxylesterase